MKSKMDEESVILFHTGVSFLQFVPVGVLLISNYEWKG